MCPQGSVLRSIEQEWGTLMFFGTIANDDSRREKMIICGPKRGRRGAELKVMSAVEHKNPGLFTGDNNKLKKPLSQPGDDEGDGFGYDQFPFEGDAFSYALGAQGSTRRMLAAAADSDASTTECAGIERRESKETAPIPEHESLATTALPSSSADPTTANGTFGGWSLLTVGSLFRGKGTAPGSPILKKPTAKTSQHQPPAGSQQQHDPWAPLGPWGYDPLSRVQTSPESLW